MKIVLLLIFLYSSFLSAIESNVPQEKIKLYSFYTPSHKILVDNWFLPTIQDDYEIIMEYYAQECSLGEYMKTGWIQCMFRKVDLIIKAIKENWGKLFIHSDVDIQFFKPTKNILLKLMGDNDILLQCDKPTGAWCACAGFFICRANNKTLQLWQEVKTIMKKNLNNYHDQHALNLLLEKNDLNLTWALLPPEFFNGGTLTGKQWSPGNSLPVPPNIVLHHANWTIGINNKIAQLEYVRKQVEKMQKN